MTDLELLDKFAGEALSDAMKHNSGNADKAAEEAYAVAQAMLREKGKWAVDGTTGEVTRK